MYEETKTAIEYKKLEKEAKSSMRLSSAITFALILIPATLVCAFLLEIETFGIVCLCIAWSFATIYTIVAPNIRYERYRYCIDDEAIRVRRGLLWIKEDVVPIERLHKLQTSQGPIDRIFKLSAVNVTTAGGDITIKFLKENIAAEIADTLKKKINEITIKEREK